MKAKCLENKMRNTNFTIGKIYDMSRDAIRTNWGGMWTHFKNYNKPKSFEVGHVFDFAFCKFEII